MTKNIITPCGERIEFSVYYSRSDDGTYQAVRNFGQNVPDADFTIRFVRTAVKMEGAGTCTARHDLDGNLVEGQCLRRVLYDQGLKAVTLCSRRTA